MRYALTILFLVIGTVHAETCTVSGKIVTCSDGSRAVQQGAVITVTPGEGNMAELGVTYNDRYAGAGAGLRAAADMYNAGRAAEVARFATQQQALSEDANRYEQRYQFDQRMNRIEVPKTEADIQRLKAEEDLAREQARLDKIRTDDTRAFQQGTLANQMNIAKMDDARLRELHNVASGADKLRIEAEMESRARGDYNNQVDQELGALGEFSRRVRGMDSTLPQGDPRRAVQTKAFVDTLANTAPGLAKQYFGSSAQGLSFARTSDGKFIPTAVVDGKRVARVNGVPAVFDDADIGQYEAYTATELADIADARAAVAGSSMNSGERSKRRTTDLTAQAQEAVAEQTLPLQVGTETADARTAAAAKAAERKSNAQEGIRTAMQSTFDSLSMGNAALRAAKPGRIENALGATSATGLTRKDYKDYELATGKGKNGAPITAGDIIKHNLDAQMPKILGDATAVNYLRQAGIPIPDGPLETWTPDQQKAVGQQLTQALVGLIAAPAEQGGGLAALQDGIQERDLPGLRAALVQPPGAVNPNRYRDEGAGWLFNRAEQF